MGIGGLTISPPPNRNIAPPNEMKHIIPFGIMFLTFSILYLTSGKSPQQGETFWLQTFLAQTSVDISPPHQIKNSGYVPVCLSWFIERKISASDIFTHPPPGGITTTPIGGLPPPPPIVSVWFLMFFVFFYVNLRMFTHTPIIFHDHPPSSQFQIPRNNPEDLLPSQML